MRRAFWALFGALIFLIGCATTSSNVVQDVGVPRYDMGGSINGVAFDGVGVIPSAPSYTMHVESKEDIDLLTVTTCHRDFAAQAAIKQNWFKANRGYDYPYYPAIGIEDTAACLIRIGSYNANKQGLNGHAIVMLQDPLFKLPAENICDGADGQTGGVSLCQSKAGLVQRLKFPTQTKLVSGDVLSDQCRGNWVDATTFEYKMSADECALVFDEVAPPHRKHLHYAFRYTYTKIRGATP